MLFVLAMVFIFVGLANSQPLPSLPIRIGVDGYHAITRGVSLQKGIARIKAGARAEADAPPFSHQRIYQTAGAATNLVGFVFPAEIYAGVRDDLMLVAADLEGEALHDEVLDRLLGELLGQGVYQVVPLLIYDGEAERCKPALFYTAAPFGVRDYKSAESAAHSGCGGPIRKSVPCRRRRHYPAHRRYCRRNPA